MAQEKGTCCCHCCWLLLPQWQFAGYGSTCAYASAIKRHKVVIKMLSPCRNLLSYELLIIKGGPVAQREKEKHTERERERSREVGKVICLFALRPPFYDLIRNNKLRACPNQREP